MGYFIIFIIIMFLLGLLGHYLDYTMAEKKLKKYKENPKQHEEEVKNKFLDITSKMMENPASFPWELKSLVNLKDEFYEPIIGIYYELTNKLYYDLFNEIQHDDNLKEYVIETFKVRNGLNGSNLHSQTKGVLEFYSNFNAFIYDEFNKRLSSKGFNEYSFVEISKNSRNLKNGEYIYAFNDDNLLLQYIEVEKQIIEININDDDKEMHMFNIFLVENMEETVVISFNDIKDFEIFGNEHISLEFENAEEINKGSFLNELIFGTGTSVVKGIKNAILSLKNKSVDLRIIQLRIKPNKDILFRGINIYYDLARYLGKEKNRESQYLSSDELQETQLINNLNDYNKIDKFEEVPIVSNVDYIEELKELKKLLDAEIITQKEFDSKKKEILSREN